MTRQGLELLLERVATWSEEAQLELVHSIAEIEARHQNGYELTEEDYAAIDRGIADAEAGRFASAEAVEALFNRYRT